MQTILGFYCLSASKHAFLTHRSHYDSTGHSSNFESLCGNFWSRGVPSQVRPSARYSRHHILLSQGPEIGIESVRSHEKRN